MTFRGRNKLKYLGVIFLLFTCLIASSAVAQDPPSPIINKALTDTDFTFDQDAGLDKVTDFFVALPSLTTEAQTVAAKIKKQLAGYGYRYQEFMGHSKDLIVIMFTVTNEVRQIDVYTDESGLAQTAEMYKMFVDTAQTFTPDIRDPSKNTLFRRQKVALPIESLTIQAYILKNKSLLKKVWEGSAGSVEGTSLSLPDLTAQVMANFPKFTTVASPER